MEYSMSSSSQLRWTKITCSPSIPPHPVHRRMSNDRWTSIDCHIYPPSHPKHFDRGSQRDDPK